MRIVRLEVTRLPLTLREPYTIAYETISAVENVLVQLITDGGVSGWGCAAPDEGVTGETVEACVASLEAVDERLRRRDALSRVVLLEQAKPLCGGAPAALAALDMALHDLLGKVAGLPVYVLLGGYRSAIPTSMTVFLEAPEEMARRAAEHVAAGFRALKLKGGRDVEADLDALARVRATIGPHVELRFDANQGWSVEDAKRFLDGSRHLGLELLEQPLPRGQADDLRAVTRHAAIPVMADESLHDLADAFRLARGDVVDMVNVKLMKVGGIDEALAVNAVARAAGYEVMVGCMDETALAISASLAFALARPNVAYADLDGHLDLLDDPTAGAVTLQAGVLRPREAPGLGWEPA